MNEERRFWRQVTKTPECWIWTGIRNSSGHGRFWLPKGFVMAYIWLWEKTNGPVPVGKELHHKCENPPCVRPDHLEPKTRREHCQEHMRNRKCCRRGHAYTKDSVYFDGDGRRHCKECLKITGGHHYKQVIR